MIETHGATWLTLKSADRSESFCFKQGDERPFLVGSNPKAHYRIVNAPLLCFYIEREGRNLNLVPAYPNGAIRLNAQSLRGPTLLPSNGVVEFGRERIELSVQNIPSPGGEVEPIVGEDVSVHEATTTIHECDESLETKVESLGDSHEMDELPTQVIESGVDSDDIETESDAELSVEEPATQILGSLPEFDESTHAASNVPEARYEPAVIHPRIFEPTPVIEPTEGIPFDDFVPPSASAARNDKVESSVVSEKRTFIPSPFSVAASALKSRSSVSERLRQFTLFANQKPIIAVGGVLLSCLMMGLFVAGATVAFSNSTSGDSPSPRASTASVPTAPSVPSAPTVATASQKQSKKLVLSDEETQAEAERGSDANAEADTNADDEDVLPWSESRVDELDRAVGHLMAGRYDEATTAYRSLAEQEGASDEVTTLYRLIELHTRGSSADQPSSLGLPEIYQ